MLDWLNEFGEEHPNLLYFIYIAMVLLFPLTICILIISGIISIFNDS